MRRLAKVKFEGRKKLDYRVDEAYKSLRTNVQFSGSGVQAVRQTRVKVVWRSILPYPLRRVANVLS